MSLQPIYRLKRFKQMVAQKTYKLTYIFLDVTCTFETSDINTLLKKLDTLKESHEVNKQSITINTFEK